MRNTSSTTKTRLLGSCASGGQSRRRRRKEPRVAETYLGETLVTDLKGTPYEDYKPEDWALEYILKYGGIDGEHHKTWVLDQVARILCGTAVTVTKAAWDRG